MTRKSDGEKIDELEKIVSTLVERVDNVRREMIDKERLAVIEIQVADLRQASKDSASKRSAFMISFLTGLAIAVLGILGNIAYLTTRK